MRTRDKRDEETSFINVDLDVWASRSRPVGGHSFMPRTFIRDRQAEGGYQMHLELAPREEMDPWNADVVIRSLATLLEALPADLIRLWNEATRRVFDIGIQGGTRPNAFQLTLAPDTLAAALRMCADVAVTVYASNLPVRRVTDQAGK